VPRSQLHVPPGFAAGTWIDTTQGLMSVEHVKLGMALQLPGGGGATVMWRSKRTVTLPDAVGDTHPILISRGAIAPGQPRRDHVINVHGCLTETMLLGPGSLASLPGMDRLHLIALFAPSPVPQNPQDTALNGPPAYPCGSVGAGWCASGDSACRAPAKGAW